VLFGRRSQQVSLEDAECDDRGSQCCQVGEKRRDISFNIFWKRIRTSRGHQEACLHSKSGRTEQRALKQTGKGRVAERRLYPKYDSIAWSYILLSSIHFSHPFPSHPIPSHPSLPFNPLKPPLIDTKKPLRSSLLLLWLNDSHARLWRKGFTTTMVGHGTRTRIIASATSQSAHSLTG
jgi:hypothetical protein